MQRLSALSRRLPEPAAYALGSIPLGLLVYALVTEGLGPDPVKAIENDLGLWALRFLLASLAISPLRWLGLNLLRFRRALGLLAFGYAALHLTAWIGLDLGLRLSQAVEDMVKRPYVLVGMLGFAAMLPLALTSTKASIRRMGARGWNRLHRLAYAALVLGALHFTMLSRVWTAELLAYLALAIVLLGARVIRPIWRSRGSASAERIATGG